MCDNLSRAALHPILLLTHPDLFGRYISESKQWRSFQLRIESNPSLRFGIGPKNSCHLLKQSNKQLEPIVIWLFAFPAFHAVCFNLSSLWLMMMTTFALIGCCDYFGYGFGHSIENDSSLWSCMTLSTYLVPAVNRTRIIFKPGVWHYIPY